MAPANARRRGDYSRAGADYTCPQNHAGYTQADHDTYRRLYERQAALVPGRACDEFLAALPSLGAKERIPHFDEINERLHGATRWEIVAVPGLIPEVPFFTLLANRKFPVTDWIRTPEEFDYIVEPDVFHDLFGHVPLLFKQTYFVIESFQELFDKTAPDFTPIYERVHAMSELAADAVPGLA